jgi:hypothetical protein
MTLRSLEVLPFNVNWPTRVPSTDACYQSVLADGVAETMLVPAGARFVRLAGTKDFYAAFGSTGVSATIASSDASAGNGTELLTYAKGEHWRFLGSEVAAISVISSSAQTVTAEFFRE